MSSTSTSRRLTDSRDFNDLRAEVAAQLLVNSNDVVEVTEALGRVEAKLPLVFSSLTLLKNATPSVSVIYALVTSRGLKNYSYVLGDFTGKIDDLLVVKLNNVDLTTGALVRQDGLLSAFDFGVKGDGVTNDALALQSALNASVGKILRIGLTSAGYVLNSPVSIPSNTTLIIDNGVSFWWNGDSSYYGGMLEMVNVSNISISTSGSVKFSLYPGNTATGLWAVSAFSVSKVSITNVQGVKVGHVRFCAGKLVGGVPTHTEAKYDEVTTGTNGNTCKNITVIGGGSRDFPQQGALILYSQYWTVHQSKYDNVGHGLQWWGGDANHNVNGAVTNERKCTDFQISEVVATEGGNGGIWGSMGLRGRVHDCTVTSFHDVGLDAEGCSDVQFIDCASRFCNNGCLSAFYLNKAVKFIDCTAQGAVLFRAYNSSGSQQNEGASFQGCTFVGPDTGFGSVDDGFGPSKQIEMLECQFINVIVSFTSSNNRVVFENNRLRYTRAITGVNFALKIGGLTGNGYASVTGNRFFADTVQDASVNVIDINQGEDFNSGSLVIVENNQTKGWSGKSLMHHFNPSNAGVSSRVEYYRNTFDRPIAFDGSQIISKRCAGNRDGDSNPLDLTYFTLSRNGNGNAFVTVTNTFVPITLNTANPSIGGFNNSTGIWTVQEGQQGAYHVSWTMRLVDNAAAGTSYNVSVGTENGESPLSSWGITNGKREGLSGAAVMNFTVGQQVRMSAFVDKDPGIGVTAAVISFAKLN